MEFTDCPTCADDSISAPAPFSDAAPCPTCQGTGHRPINTEALDLARMAHAWLTGQVTAVFLAYCKVHHIHPAYGVRAWEDCGSTIEILQDTTSRGCSSTTEHTLPSKYLQLPESLCALAIEHDALTKLAQRPGATAHVQAAALMPYTARLSAIQIEIDARLAQLGRTSLYVT